MMTVETSYGVPMSGQLLYNYLRNLVNQFFKILPLRESEERSLTAYMGSLQCELIGANDVIASVDYNPLFLSLIAILQYLIDNPDSTVTVYKREVFKAISICNKLKAKYAESNSCAKEAKVK